MPKQKKKKKRFIQKAIKRPGRLRKIAAKEGGLTKDGRIKKTWLAEKKREAKKKGDKSLLSAIILAERFKSGDLSKKKRKPKKKKGAKR